MLSQLVYLSRRKENCTSVEIAEILDDCKRNNPALGISGILLYTEEKFIQLVEGDSIAIMTLYEKIKKDERHKDCVMLSYAPIQEKSFPSWHMGSKKIEGSNIEYDTNITAEDKKIFDQILAGQSGDSQAILHSLKKFFK